MFNRPLQILDQLVYVILYVRSSPKSYRLTQVIHHIIEENQGLLLKHRVVAPNVLVGIEVIYQVTNAPKSTNHLINIAIKLDLSKTFDRIEWSFLISIIHKLDFSRHFIHITHRCLSSTKISIQYNQSRMTYFI